MFTGIVETLGRITQAQPAGGHLRLVLEPGAIPPAELKVGDSIAVNGACLTVAAVEAAGFAVDVSPESLHCTTLGSLSAGDRVNLERAVVAGRRLDGHLVCGHVDGVGKILAREMQNDALELAIIAPEELKKFIVRKGSVCVDGVSLTVNEVQDNAFSVQIVPHTRTQTLCGGYRVADRVNIEVDLVARYLDGLLAARVDTHK
ncbi:MAG TPA: riboflavin synthase [Gammaproteobacteria bacterium]|nr:riboflavin synthase [Gammaproteobacteria bacterium]